MRTRSRRSFYCREWVFEKIQTCLERRKQQDDTKTKGAFIVGGPGSGKTTLLTELISPSTKDALQNELSKKVLAYHFCEAHNYSSVSVSEFVRSLADQLSTAEPLGSYREKFNDPQIQDALKREECAKNPDVSFKEGILLPLNSIAPPEDVYLVVVDSIDESFLHSFDSGVFSGSRTIAELVATHHDLLPSWLFLVISARKQSKTVTKMFTGFRKLTLDDLRKAYVVKDIQGYILNRLDDDKELRKYLTRETAEKFNQLHIKSNGCFLYLERVLDGVESQLFSLEDVQDIPGTLNGLYLWLCNRLYTQKQFNQIRLVLNVILASQKPLTEMELFQAVWTRSSSMSSEEFQSILEMMEYTVINVEDRKCVFHHSFAEWLIDVKHCTPKYLCSPSDGHAMLALRCTLLASNKQSVDLHQFAVHLSRASFKEELTQEHFALWLLWSGAPLSEALFATELPRQEALQILLDAGADVSNLDNSGELTLNYGKETEESIKVFLEKSASVDRVDSAGRTQLCTAAFNGNADVVKLLLQHGANVNFSDPAGESPLILAAKQGHADVVYLLVNCGANVNQVTNDGCTALRASASGGHSDVVLVLLKHGAVVDLADDDKRTALRGAAWGGHTDVVQQLFQHGANLNLTDKDGRSALIAAAYMGHRSVVRFLLEHNADVNLADKDGRTALSVAVLCISASPEHTEVVRLLLQHNADVDRPDFDGMTSLCVACLEGHYNVVKLLLNANADISHWDRNGRTPLFAAAASGHVGIVKILLEKNNKMLPISLDDWRAPKDAMFRPDSGGWTPLMVASFQGHSTVVKALLEAGVHTDDTDKDGKSSLMIAAQEGHGDVLFILLDFGAPVNQRTVGGRTALYYAAMEGHPECVDILIKFEADINGVDNLGRTDLFSVTIEGNEEMVNHLLRQGAVVDCVDNDGRTPLQGAAWQGNYNLVELLLKFTADVNLPDNYGRTALMSAAWQGQNCVIQLMIDQGAEVDKVSLEGATALSIACQEGHDEVAQILLENGANMNHTDLFGRTPMQVASEAGHTKIMKALEAYSVLRMNDSNFTSALKQKVLSPPSPTLQVASASTPIVEVSIRKESISSSGSSTQGSRHDISSQGEEEGACGSLLTPSFSHERRYSSSFLEVHKVHVTKEAWNAKCPPYSSQETVHHEPPPYSEQPVNSGVKVNDDISPVRPNSPKARRKPFSMLHKVKIKSPFASGGSGDRKSKSKSPNEKRKMFSSRKSSNSASVKSTETSVESPCSTPEYRLSDSHNSVETSV